MKIELSYNQKRLSVEVAPEPRQSQVRGRAKKISLPGPKAAMKQGLGRENCDVTCVQGDF